MKVIAINGSPRGEGNTYHALKLVLEQLEEHDIETEIVHVGNKIIRGCMACGGCAKNKDEQCVINDDVNTIIQKMKSADGIIIGSPVYYASIAGTMKCFLDRAFYTATANGGLFRHKVGASVVVARRSGEVATFDHLNHYFTVGEMFVTPSNYWNVIHGRTPGEVLQDEEGIQIMRVLGKNMAFLLNAVAQNQDSLPAREEKIVTSFIR